MADVCHNHGAAYMPKRPEPESFEVTEYDPDDLPEAEKLAAVKQAVQDYKNDPEITKIPSGGVQLHIQGDRVKLVYHCYDMHLSDHLRLQEVERQCEQHLTDALKGIKKKYKEITRKALSLKELKDLRDYSVQKVSLNERYYATFWRVYSLG